MAQTAKAGSTAAPAASTDVGTLTEVVVQARKRNESVMKTPVVMEVVTTKQIQNLRITDTSQLATVTPGLSITPISAVVGAIVNLRGLGNGGTANFLDQSVQLNIDGASLPNGLFYRSALFDLGQIEVLKGPQALFFGKSSSAGIIAIHSAGPTSYWDTAITTGYEFNAGEFRTEGHISGPVAPGLDMRFAGYYTHIDGYLTNPNPANTVHQSPNGNENGERFSLKYSPDGTGLKVKFNISRSDLSELGGPGDEVQLKCAGKVPQIPSYVAYDDCKLNTIAGGLRNTPPYNPALTYSLGNASAFAAGTPNPLFGVGEGYTKIKTLASTLNADYDIAHGLTLTSLTSYSYAHGTDVSTVATGANGLVYLATDNRVDDWSQELRLTSNWTDSPVNFMGGLLYDTLTGKTETALDIPSFTIYTDNLANYRETTYSGFAQVLIDPIKTVELSLGARYSEVERRFTSLIANNNVFPSSLTGQGIQLWPSSAAVGGGASGIKERNLSPEFTGTWRPTSDLTAFVSYKQGYKGPGMNIVNPTFSFKFPNAVPLAVSTVAGEKSDGFEGGVKSFFLDRRLAFTASAYSYKYTNLQVSVVGPTFQTSVFNGADARVQGFETGVDYRPDFIPGLTARVFVNYNDSKYTKFKNAPCYGGEGCVTQDLAGQRLSKAPLWAGSVGLSYEHDIWDQYRASADMNVNFSSSYNVTAEGNPVGLQSGYATLDLAVRFAPKNDRWSIGVIGRNLTDEIYMINGVDGGVHSTSPTADLTAFANRPRQVVLQLTLHP